MKHKAITAQCTYHLGHPTEVTAIEIRGSYCGKTFWERHWACSDCRRYLRGVFRYVKATGAKLVGYNGKKK